MSTTAPRATLALAFRDLGFVGGIFISLIGGPSVITLLQAVLADFRLSAILQWLIDGYNDLLSVLTLGLEPLLAGVLAQLGALFPFDVDLEPHWRPLFVLALIFISANTRTIWGDGYRGPAVLYAVFAAVCTLIGSVVAGVVPSGADAVLHGGVAALFVLLHFFGLFLAYALATVAFDFTAPYRQPLGRYLLRDAVLAMIAFIAAVALSVGGAPVERPGLTAVFMGMFVYGVYWLSYGLLQDVFPEVRFGLRLVGGFVFAFGVIALDALARGV